jgi:hypothetical protein
MENIEAQKEGVKVCISVFDIPTGPITIIRVNTNISNGAESRYMACAAPL